MDSPDRGSGRRTRRCADAGGEFDEHANAVAGRAAAEGVAAILVEQCGAEHVDMCPGALTRELLQERRSDDRIAEALARGVAQIGHRRVDEGPVARMQRPGPGKIAACVPRVDYRITPRKV